jgi:hypothetical protein
MGHVIFVFLHLIAIMFGFIGLFLTIPLHLIYSAASKKPAQFREDGKKKNSGLLGGLVDGLEVELSMRDCPYCTKKINKAATKCPYCQSEVEAIPITETDRRRHGNKKGLLYLVVTLAAGYFIYLFSGI